MMNIEDVLGPDPDPEAAKRAKIRIIDPADKAKQTMGEGVLLGRSTLKQQEFLFSLGVPREVSVNLTKHAASEEIKRRLGRAQ